MSRGSGWRPPHYCLLGNPEAEPAWVKDVSVDERPMEQRVQRGQSRPARALKTITVGDAVHSSAPGAKGIRVPIRDIAEIVANGDRIEAIVDA